MRDSLYFSMAKYVNWWASKNYLSFDHHEGGKWFQRNILCTFHNNISLLSLATRGLECRKANGVASGVL